MSKLKEFITNELIDQIIEAALALLAIGFGINYFLYADAWMGAVASYAGSMGSSIAAQEANLMFKTVSNTFPFNYLTQTSFNHVILAGMVLFVIGTIIKVLTTPSRAELTIDFGKILIVPGIIGVISLVGIQLLTTRSINSLFIGTTLRTAETAVDQANAGLLVWNMMGSLFLMGIMMLFFGHQAKRKGRE